MGFNSGFKGLSRPALHSAGGPYLLYVTSSRACVHACVRSSAVSSSRPAYSSLLGAILSIGLAFCQRILNTCAGLVTVCERLLAQHYNTERQTNGAR